VGPPIDKAQPPLKVAPDPFGTLYVFST
jgi:hypothetical protein